MEIVRVVIGAPLLLALIGVPGWLALRLLRRPAPDTPATPDDLIPAETAFLSVALGICIVGPIALVLAMLGVYALWLLALLVALGSAGLVIWLRRESSSLVLFPLGKGGKRRFALAQSSVPVGIPSPQSLFVLLLVGAAVLFLRPGEMILGGEDTGVYYNSGVAEAKTGSIRLHDADFAAIAKDEATVRHLLLPTPHWRYRFLDGGRLHGFFANGTSGDVTPQFVHLWPTWLAVFYGFFGLSGPAYAPALCGLLGLTAVALLGRRLFGWPVALLAGLFLALNGMEVWFVRQTFTEPFQQFALFTALFGLLLLEERRNPTLMRLGAVVAAVALGSAALTHEETIFLVPLVVAYAVALWLLRAWQRAHTIFFATVGAFFALALFQAFVFALGYTEGLFHNVYKKVWARADLLALVVVPAGIVALLYVNQERSRWLPFIRRPDVQRAARYAVAAIVAAYFCYAYILRPGIVLGHRGTLTSYIGAPTPPGNAANLVRLGWYWSPLGIALVAIGATLLIGRGLNRLTGGFLAIALVHTVIFVNETYTSEQYIYALRRDVPVIVPVCALFAAYAAWHAGPAIVAMVGSRIPRAIRTRVPDLRQAERGGAPLRGFVLARDAPVSRADNPAPRRWSGAGVRLSRALGLVSAAALALFFVATSMGTWTVRRYAGVEDQLGRIAATFPENSLLLFSGDRDQPHLLATPLNYIYGRSAFVISTEYPRGDLLETWLLRESATRPVYVLMGDDGGKLFLPHTALVPDMRYGPTFTVILRDFEALQRQKPHNAQENSLRYTVYRFDPRAGMDGVLGPLPLTITAGQADERYNVQGFYGIEYDRDDPMPYRWTGPNALLRIPWTPTLAQDGGTLTLHLGGGERPTMLGAAHLRVGLLTGVGESGPTIGEMDIGGQRADYTVHIPPYALPMTDDGTALIQFNSCADLAKIGKDRLACSAWSPQDAASPDAPIYDARILGVQVQSVTVASR